MKKNIFFSILIFALFICINISNVYAADSRRQTIDETKQSADAFIDNADTSNTINEADLQTNISLIYNIFFACGMVVAVGCGVFLGVKFMTSSIEGQAEIKEKLIPYFIGCAIIFGAFGIWKIVINVMEKLN